MQPRLYSMSGVQVTTLEDKHCSLTSLQLCFLSIFYTCIALTTFTMRSRLRRTLHGEIQCRPGAAAEQGGRRILPLASQAPIPILLDSHTHLRNINVHTECAIRSSLQHPSPSITAVTYRSPESHDHILKHLQTFVHPLGRWQILDTTKRMAVSIAAC
jgi:hypothetical protein